MPTGNPTLSDTVFQRAARQASGSGPMTINGTVNKTAILLLLVVAGAAWCWSRFTASGGDPAAIGTYLVVGGVGGLVLALATVFKPQWSPVTAPVYALLEGLAIGGLSAMMEAQFPGIVLQAVALTFGTLAALLAAYRSRLIRVTNNFRLGVVAATGGIFVVYLVDFVMHLLGHGIPYIHGSGMISIGFSLFVVALAALNLVLDFDSIERGAAQGAPRYMEWYGAFGLMVTLIWLYIEILRLLSKLQQRR